MKLSVTLQGVIIPQQGRSGNLSFLLKKIIDVYSTYTKIYTFYACSSMNVYIFRDTWKGFPGDPVVKNLPANAGDSGLIPGLGRSLGWEDPRVGKIPWRRK